MPCWFLDTVSKIDLYKLMALPSSVLVLYFGLLMASFKILATSLLVFSYNSSEEPQEFLSFGITVLSSQVPFTNR